MRTLIKRTLVCALASLPIHAAESVSVTISPPASVTVYRGSSKIGSAPTVDACVDAAKRDSAARKASGTYACDPTRHKVVATYQSATTVVGKWERQGREWQQFVMPYDGVVIFRDQHPAAVGSELHFRKGDTVPCLSANHGGPFADVKGITFSFFCDSHPDGVVAAYPTVDLPMMGQMPGMPIVDSHRIPAPNPLATDQFRARPSTPERTGFDIGAFRNICDYSHFGFDDPIVYPGIPGAAHLHTFCGNASTDANSTMESLSVAKSTSFGGVANRSAYWWPALLMPDPNNAGQYLPIIPLPGNNYYKSGYNNIPIESLIPFPRGLRLIAGNVPTNTSAAGAVGGTGWSCRNADGSVVRDLGPTIPACPPGAELSLHVLFPNCWDGKNLDSSNHRSHVVYPQEDGRCPTDHPQGIIQLGVNVGYTVPPGADTTAWKLSCDMGQGGLCLHADVIANWSDGIDMEWMRGCIYPRSSCQGNMNSGRELY